VIFTVKNVCLDAVNFQNGLDILQQANTTNQMPKKRQIQQNLCVKNVILYAVNCPTGICILYLTIIYMDRKNAKP